MSTQQQTNSKRQTPNNKKQITRNKKQEKNNNTKLQTPNNKKIVTTAWFIAYTALWNTTEFSEQEINNTFIFINNFINQAPNPQKAYEAFVQRILLARNYVNKNETKYIPLPSIWFATQNKNGFVGTAQWLENINNTRKALPQYKVELVAFAQAIQECHETLAAKDFHYWRSYFILQNKQGLLNLFLSTIANLRNK
jgi:hypothetical protein